MGSFLTCEKLGFDANRCASLFLAMLVGAHLAATKSAHAAPVKFHFDATIGTVFPGVPFDSGIEFAVGDVISGQFTFDPNDGDGETSLTVPQPFPFLIAIRGVELTSPNYAITANDDAFVIDFEGASIVDQLELVGAGLSAIDAAADINIDPFQSTFGIDLWGASDFAEVLETANIPSSVEIWNQFEAWRNLQVTLRNGEGGVAGFSATVGNFSQIPEPAGACLSLSAAIGVVMLRRRVHKVTLKGKQEFR